MIDYQATVSEFFKSVLAFLLNAASKATDKDELNRIQINMRKIERVAANPIKYASYAARVKDDLVVQSDGFIPVKQPSNNAVFLAFTKVLAALDEMYRMQSVLGCGVRVEEEKMNFLAALKVWKYQTSTSLFKDFVFPFKSATSFAVHVQQNQK